MSLRTELFREEFEVDLSKWKTYIGGAPVLQSNIVYGGSKAVLCPPSTSLFHQFTPALNKLYVEAMCYYTNILPDAVDKQIHFISLQGAAYANIVFVGVYKDPTLTQTTLVVWSPLGHLTFKNMNIPNGVWIKVGLEYTCAVNGGWKAWINDVEVANITNVDTSSLPCEYVHATSSNIAGINAITDNYVVYDQYTPIQPTRFNLKVMSNVAGRFTVDELEHAFGETISLLPGTYGVKLPDTIVVSGGGVIHASGGSAGEIQDAVDQAGDGDFVQLPAGSFPFSTSPPWTKVTVPMGVSIFGHPAGTTLTVPWAAPDNSQFFGYIGSSNLLTRFSGIKLVGYREINPSSLKNRLFGIGMRGASGEVRIDHNHLRNLCGEAIDLFGIGSRGVVDHNILENYPFICTGSWDENSVWYGINVSNGASYDADMRTLMGKYTPKTFFIEDNYFSGWRHSVLPYVKAHAVVRKNIFALGGNIDCHDGFTGAMTMYGNCLVEAYENSFGPFDRSKWNMPFSAINLRSGAGIVTRNKAVNLGTPNVPNDWAAFIFPWNMTPDAYPEQQVHQTYIWDNELTNCDLYELHNDGAGSRMPVLNQDFFLRAPSLALDGFAYTPYTYPHPLTGV